MDTIVLRDGRRGKAVMQIDGEWWISVPQEKPVRAPWSEIASVMPRDPIIRQLLDGCDDAK